MKNINLQKTRANMEILNKRAWLRRKLAEHPADQRVDPAIISMLLGGYYPLAGPIGQQLLGYLREDGFLVEEDDEQAA
jgi:hypothetical protein